MLTLTSALRVRIFGSQSSEPHLPTTILSRSVKMGKKNSKLSRQEIENLTQHTQCELQPPRPTPSMLYSLTICSYSEGIEQLVSCYGKQSLWHSSNCCRYRGFLKDCPSGTLNKEVRIRSNSIHDSNLHTIIFFVTANVITEYFHHISHADTMVTGLYCTYGMTVPWLLCFHMTVSWLLVCIKVYTMGCLIELQPLSGGHSMGWVLQIVCCP